MTSTPTLSNLEWTAVSIALQDAHRCGCAPNPIASKSGFLARLNHRLFGEPQPNGLADPKLEAVRRFVCTTARRRQRADEMMPALKAHGFSPAQIDALALLSA